jgi:hypothetical protein
MQYYEVNSTNVTIITDILNTAPGAQASLPGNAEERSRCLDDSENVVNLRAVIINNKSFSRYVRAE